MKKLIVSLGIVFLYSNLFGATAVEDILGQSASIPQQGLLPQTTDRLTGLPVELIHHIFDFLPSADQESFRRLNRQARQILPTALTLDIETAQPTEIPQMVDFLKSRQGIKRLRIRCIRGFVVESTLAALLRQNFTFPALRELDISGNIYQVTLLLLEQIRELMPHLTSLNMGQSRIGDAGAASLAQMAQLTSLNVEYSDIGPAGAASLAQLAHLTSLNISNNRIGPAGAASLAQLAQLTSLDIRFNRIGAAGAASLAHLSQLRSLDIRNNLIGDAGAASLAQMAQLTSLNVEYSNIGPAGAASLAQLAQLTSLDIRFNRIGISSGLLLRQHLSLTKVVF